MENMDCSPVMEVHGGLKYGNAK